VADATSGKLSGEAIREYWKEQALRHGDDVAASWSDRSAVELEVRTIAPRIPPGAVVADLGCGNGWSTVQYAAVAKHVLGVDYVPELIDSATRRAASLDGDLPLRLGFTVDDVRSLAIEDATMDCVVMTRVLINLLPDERHLALREVGRILKPGGVALISEATLGGWRQLNTFRAEWGLEPIPEPAFNYYVDETKLRVEAAPLLELDEIVDFASTYFVLTRVLKPLLARIPGIAVDAADPESEFNRFAASLPAGGDYGTQKLFVLHRASMRLRS
jgi:SAM-dependent methyltransferase